MHTRVAKKRLQWWPGWPLGGEVCDSVCLCKHEWSVKTGPLREEMRGSLGSQKLHGYAEEEISRSLSCQFNLKCFQLKLTFCHLQDPTFLMPNHSKALCMCAMCSCVCMWSFMCVHVLMHVLMCAHVFMYACIHVCVHVCVCSFVYMHVFMCVHVLMCVLMLTCACVHVCAHVFMCVCACACVCYVWRTKDNLRFHSSVAFSLLLFSLRQLISLELTNRLGWLTSKTQGSACFGLPSAGIPSAGHCGQHFPPGF